MKKRGFTLIELLAVIVILAIIALIATPMILNIIKDTKKESYKRSAELYLDGVELAVMRKNLNSTEGFNPSQCEITLNEAGEREVTCDGEPLEVDVQGETPTRGIIYFEDHKIAKDTTLTFQDYQVTMLENGKLEIESIPEEGQGGESSETTPIACFNYTVENNEVTITDYYAYQGNDSSNEACPKDVVLPRKIDGVPVTRIGNRAFSDGMGQSNRITSIVIPNTVISIGEYAFFYNDLTSVTIPDSVTTLENGAFYNNIMTSVTIPNSVTSIGVSAFASNWLTNVVIPETMTSIPDSMFSGNKLKSATIPDSVTSIGASAFASNQLESITLPKNLTSIGNNAFSANQLEEITIPSTVTSIGSSAFETNALKSATIPNSILIIEDRTFANNQLKSITLPNKLTKIGASAFQSNQLESITIPGTVTNIGASSFASNQLENISIPNSVTTLGSGAFADNQFTNDVYIYGRKADGSVDYSVLNSYAGKNRDNVTLPTEKNGVSLSVVEASCFANIPMSDLTLPDSLTYIGANAFSGYTSNSIVIPENVTYIGMGAFGVMHNISSVTIYAKQENITLEYYAFGFMFSNDNIVWVNG